MRRFAMILAALAATGAGVAASAQSPIAPPPPGEPIRGADGWFLLERLPGAERRACAIRRPGPEANLTILQNNVGKPVFMLGRQDWGGMRGDARASLSIDGAAPVAVDTSMVHNLVITMLDDEAVLQRARGAASLEWTLPFGRFRTEVGGMNTALGAQATCLAQH